MQSNFQFEVRPSPDTGDHEVRVKADGVDLIDRFWNDMIGLDPDELLLEPCLLRATEIPKFVTVARCNCGYTGCGSVEVEIVRREGAVVWTYSNLPPVLCVEAQLYDAAIECAIQDTSWETPDRTVARLIRTAVDQDAPSMWGMKFSWASGRLREQNMTVSLTLNPGPYQILLHIPIDSLTPDEAAIKCIEALSTPPASWADVQWLPQRLGLLRPELAGPGWSEKRR